MRIGVWLLVLAVAGAFLYMNKVGLPGFMKRRVVSALEAEGLDVGFQRLRLDGYRHIIIEKVQLVSTNAGAPMDFLAGRAELKFNRHAIKRLHLKLDAVELNDARLRLDLRQTNTGPRSLSVTNIETQIRLDARDHWTISNFEGESMGARWHFSGSLTNLLSMAPGASTNRAAPSDWEGVLRDVLSVVERIRFSSPPSISVTALGDLRDLASFRISVSLRGDAAKSPWGDAQAFFLRSSVGPSARPGEQMAATVSIKLKSAITPWAELKEATVMSETLYPLTNSAAFESTWTLRGEMVSSDWFSGRNIDVSLNTRASEGTNLLTLAQGSVENPRLPVGTATRAEFQARLQHAYPIAALNSFLTDLLPVKPAAPIPAVAGAEILTLGQNWAGDWLVSLANLQTKNGAARQISINGDVRERPDKIATDASWGAWTNFANFEIHWNAEAADYTGLDARIEKIAARGQWLAPELKIAAIDSELYGGAFHLEAALDVPSRRVAGETHFDFDLKKTASLLDPKVRPLLNEFMWEKPPKFDARISFIGPAWTNFLGTNEWRQALESTRLDGSMAIGSASFHGVTCTELSTHFFVTNLQWRFPDLVLKRPEGQLELDYAGHVFEPAFRLSIRGGIDPWAALPLLDKEGQTALKFVEFKQPPAIEGILTGDLDNADSLRFEGSLAMTNFVISNELFLDARARVIYSNQWINLFEPITHRTTNEVLMASSTGVDLRKAVAHVTNGFSTTDPYRFTKILGPIIYKAIEPYQFAKPPTVRIEGTVPFAEPQDADIHFQIAGDAFSYWRFNTTKTTAGVYWHQDLLEVTNVTAKFYGGDIEWEGHFKFKPDDSADYRFKGVATNADVALMLHDLIPANTNRIEGTLSGTLVVTEANSEDLKTWQGHGMGTVKNGFLWDIPVFGIFSPVLETVAPGLGRSKIYSGAGTFKIEDGVVHTKDMEVRAPAFRLRYDGSVDFDGNLDAKVEAQFFRDAWIFGRAMSAALWPLAKVFESKVSGNLAAPKSELAHIPKIILFPLRPIQTIKELLPKDKEKEKTGTEPK